MKQIIVKTQKELDAIKSDYSGTVYIEGGTENSPLEMSVVFSDAYVVTRGSAQVIMNCGIISEMWDSSQVRVMRDSSQVREMRDSSQVREMRDSSQVRVMRDSSQVRVMRDSSQVREMRDSSQVRVMRDSSQVREMWESSQVREMRESSQVREMWDSSQVREMRESSQVREMWDSSQVRVMRESSQVELYGESMVSARSAKKIICHGYNVVKINKSDEKDVTVVMNKDSHLIIIPDFVIDSFKEYQKHYPTKVDGKKAIFYKAVKKEGDIYISSYTKDFTYVVGEEKTEKCAPVKDGACASGIHISPKSWALNFGSGWENMALLEVEVAIKDIVVSKDTDGKIRASKVKVLREVPKEEYYA